ncbi:MAG: PP2C family serine/threonine-protein phosphatase [Ilumatobacter sp.]
MTTPTASGSAHSSAGGASPLLPILRWGGVTDVGGVRTLNEDAWSASPTVCVVADGMGGHAAGEIASGLVVDAVLEAFRSHLPPLAELPGMVSGLNAAVLQRADTDGTHGMGTTVVGVAIAANGPERCVVVFHVGDSRCYRLVDGGLVQVTTDHSHVQELIDAGRISPDDAKKHPLRNVITRALGADSGVDADFHVLDAVDCRLLLCSDGLNGEIDDHEIARLLGAGTPDQAAAQLVDAAVRDGARDNVTALVVDVVCGSSSRTAEVTAEPARPAAVTAEQPTIATSPGHRPEVPTSGHADRSPWGPPDPTGPVRSSSGGPT